MIFIEAIPNIIFMIEISWNYNVNVQNRNDDVKYVADDYLLRYLL